jgi:hypothetical protein
MTIQELIIYQARKYLGYQEIRGNKGFPDPAFQILMEKYGWQEGWAWCAVYCEVVWGEAYNNYERKDLNRLVQKLFTAGAVKTWNNFSASEDFVTDSSPEPGSIVIWQSYRDGQPHWTGHAGIVYKVYSDESNRFETIEGNTNTSGGREGIEVGKQIRSLSFEKKQRGLVLKGFIHPKE